MADENQLRRQVDATIAVLSARRVDALQRMVHAKHQAEKAEKEISALEVALRGLEPVKTMFATAALKQPPAVEQGHNRRVISEILIANRGPMKVAEIAKIAFEKGQIVSRKGYTGVYGTVMTVLSRNRVHVFVHLNDGSWDLRNRPKILPNARMTEQAKESA